MVEKAERVAGMVCRFRLSLFTDTKKPHSTDTLYGYKYSGLFQRTARQNIPSFSALAWLSMSWFILESRITAPPLSNEVLGARPLAIL